MSQLYTGKFSYTVQYIHDFKRPSRPPLHRNNYMYQYIRYLPVAVALYLFVWYLRPSMSYRLRAGYTV